jgi:hypothetical protein
MHEETVMPRWLDISGVERNLVSQMVHHSGGNKDDRGEMFIDPGHHGMLLSPGGASPLLWQLCPVRSNLASHPIVYFQYGYKATLANYYRHCGGGQ